MDDIAVPESLREPDPHENGLVVTLICLIIPDAVQNTEKPKHYTEVSDCYCNYGVMLSSLMSKSKSLISLSCDLTNVEFISEVPFRLNAIAETIRMLTNRRPSNFLVDLLACGISNAHNGKLSDEQE